MAELLELIDTIRAEEAQTRSIFSAEQDGHRIVQPNSPGSIAKLVEAVQFIADIQRGRVSNARLVEAMSTSDFPLMFGQIVDRMLLGNYQMTEPTYRNYTRIGRVRDFRTVNRFAINGGQGLLQPVPELTEYHARKVSEQKWTYNVQKYGAILPFSWESLIDDQLGAFDDIPQRLAQSARNSEENYVTKIYAGATGPNTALYTSGNKNQVITANGALTNNPGLTVAGLQDAFTVFANQIDTDGNPIVIKGVTLVVPPSLRVTAMNILNATQVIVSASGAGGNPVNVTTGAGGQELLVRNWIAGDLTVVVNPWLPLVSPTNGATTWYLFANAGDGRPAIELGFLAGHETPEMFMKASNQVRVGGGLVDPTEGDFETDSVIYKMRHVFGGTSIDPKMTIASNGTGA